VAGKIVFCRDCGVGHLPGEHVRHGRGPAVLDEAAEEVDQQPDPASSSGRTSPFGGENLGSNPRAGTSIAEARSSAAEQAAYNRQVEGSMPSAPTTDAADILTEMRRKNRERQKAFRDRQRVGKKETP
jgi:hypothetical protein